MTRSGLRAVQGAREFATLLLLYYDTIPRGPVRPLKCLILGLNAVSFGGYWARRPPGGNPTPL